MTNFYDKYLKYKIRYLELKKKSEEDEQGGGQED